MQPSLSMLPGCNRDFRELPSDDARKLALDTIVHLRNGELRGQQLDELSHTGDLSDCFKLYFDFAEHDGKPRHRLVHRKQSVKYTVLNLALAAVGERENLEVYV